MGAARLGGCGACQQFLLRDSFRRAHLLYTEHSARQGAGLVKHDGVYMGDGIQIVAPFEKDAFPRGCADAAEIPQWNADHQRTGTGNDQKHQCPVEPRVEIIHKSRMEKGPYPRHQHQKRGQRCHCRRIDTGKLADELFGRCFPRSSMLHHVKNTRKRTVREPAHRADMYDPVRRYHPGQHILARPDAAGDTFTRQGRRVERSRALQHRPVQRHTFAGFHFDFLPDGYFVRRHGLPCPVPQDSGHLRAHVQQRLDVVAGLVHGLVLKPFPHRIKEHDRKGFRIFPNIESPQGSHEHQRELVEHVTLADGFPRLPHHRHRHRQPAGQKPAQGHPFRSEKSRIRPLESQTAQQQ